LGKLIVSQDSVTIAFGESPTAQQRSSKLGRASPAYGAGEDVHNPSADGRRCGKDAGGGIWGQTTGAMAFILQS